jgi:pimeloyl-ACP methyl ester carboxylesterase/membrane protein DedA with SNARE-associated domain
MSRRSLATSAGRRRAVRLVLVGWLIALACSHLVWFLRPPVTPEAGPEEHFATVADLGSERRLRMAYLDLGPREDGAPTLVLLHGSPGRKEHMARLAAALTGRYRVILPDLPGFGDSSHDPSNYSIEAHARQVLELLATVTTVPVHVVGFSLGGAVALEMAQAEPERIASIVLLSATGVQELELFGSHELNHLVHGLQLALVQAARWLMPHFGWDDGLAPALSYARNFYDTDQRPLRRILETLELPLYVIHGEKDFLVPAAAAREHQRIVPQSELALLAGDHFMVFQRPQELAKLIAAWVDRVESGQAPRRSEATADRLARAQEPFDPSEVPPFEGPALLVLLIAIAAATLVSEDLTCISVGLLVAQGRLGFVSGTAAAFTGIFIGDVLLYLAGRGLGRPALDRVPLRWFVRPGSLARASAWFARRGAAVIFIARFTPGLRTATYFSAGVVRAGFLSFLFWFVLAGVLWTPLLVAFAAWAGKAAGRSLESLQRLALPGLIGLALVLLVVQRLLIPMFTWRGRRKLIGSWRRKRHFEYWPPWLFYAPIVGHVLGLVLRHRSLTVATCVNPAIPTGGFIGESKAEILAAIDAGEGDVARHLLLRADATLTDRRQDAAQFMAEGELGFPIVLKPDRGQRGSGVSVVADAEELERALEAMAVDSILQEFAHGLELGVFRIRAPDEEHGRVFSNTQKRLPVVVGDGEHNLEELILADERAVCMAATYFAIHGARLLEVPAAGERVQLVELGTHCRGAIFRNGSAHRTPELEAAVERVARRFEGFHFGRFDLRSPSLDDLAAGRFKVIELNGLTSEATHIYDPATPLFEAWRVLREQWSAAYAIGAENRRRGARAATLRELLSAWREYRKLQALHPPTGWLRSV